MQLKMEAMQLKVGMKNNIWGKRINKGYMFTLFLSSFYFYLVLLTSSFRLEENTTSHTCIGKTKLFSCLYNPFIQREISDTSYLILPIVTRFL